MIKTTFKNYYHYFLLLGIIILGAYLRLHHIGARPFWLDEADSVNSIKFNFSELWSKILARGLSAGYIYVIKIWSYFFGDSEIAIRSLSTLAGILSIIVIYKLLSKIFNNKKAAVLASFLLAVNYFSIFYSIQARQYSLVILLSLLSSYFLLNIFLNSNKRTDIFLYIVFTTIGIYFHHWFILLFISQILFTIFYFRFSKLEIFLWQIIIGILTTPWLIALFKMRNSGLNAWIPPVNFKTPFLTFQYFLYGSGLVFIIIIFILLAASYFRKKRITTLFVDINQPFLKLDWKILFLANSLFFPIFSAWIVSYFMTPIYVIGRYEAVSLPFLLILIALFFSKLSKPMIIISVLILSFLSYNQVKIEAETIANYKTNDRKIAQELLKKIDNGDIVLFTDISRPPFDYYLPRQNKENKKFLTISFPKEMEEHPAAKDIKGMLKRKEKYIEESKSLIDNIKTSQAKNVWVIYAFGNPINEILLADLNKNFKLIEEIYPNDLEDTTSPIAPFHFHVILKYQVEHY